MFLCRHRRAKIGEGIANCTSLLHFFNVRWLVRFGVTFRGLIFGQFICTHMILASSCNNVLSQLTGACTSPHMEVQ